MTKEIIDFPFEKNKSSLINFNKSIKSDFFPELNLTISNNNLFSKDSYNLYNNSENASSSNSIFPTKNFCLNKEEFDFKNFNNESSENVYEINNFNNINNISFQKNRNYFNNNFTTFNNKEEAINISFNINHKKYIRCDSLLIKFKSSLGKWFIKTINQKLKQLKSNHIIKRNIKFFAFNYKKFTLNVSYTKNKKWLYYKMKDLLLFGDEENQNKNEKNLKSLFKKKFEELNEIKDMLELNYRDIIEKFYCLSDEFNKFKNDKKVIELDNNFKKIMNVSLLEKNGFIEFLETRKGNKKKK